MRQSKLQKIIFLTLTGALLTVLTGICGTPFLLSLRRSYGATVFWSLGLLMTAVFFPVWFLIAPMWILMGLFETLDKRWNNYRMAALLTIFVTLLLTAVATVLLLRVYGFIEMGQVRSLVSDFIGQLQSMSPNLKIDETNFFNQLPSLMALLLVLGLGNGIIFEEKVSQWFKLPVRSESSAVTAKNSLLEFRVPDGYVWVALLSLLLVAFDFGYKSLGILALNIMNVSGAFYFFQGLAVMEYYMKFFRSGFLTRFLVYFLIVGQLFVLVSLLGLADFWMDFRQRLQLSKSKMEQEEHK